jgi:hypothetical protein
MIHRAARSSIGGEIKSQSILRLRVTMDIGTTQQYDRGFVDLQNLPIKKP